MTLATSWQSWLPRSVAQCGYAVLGLMPDFPFIEILHDFFSDLVFCEAKRDGTWSMSRRAVLLSVSPTSCHCTCMWHT